MPYLNAALSLLTLAALGFIFLSQKAIMTTQAEAAASLQSVSATLDKVSAETSGLLAEVQALKDAAANSDSVSPELQAAIDAVTSRASAIDALVPDAPSAPDAGNETPAP